MMKCIATAVLSLCLLVANGQAEGESYAVVDMEVLIKAHVDTAIAESVLIKQADEFAAERAEMLKELDALNDSFEQMRQDAESRVLSELGRDQKRLEAQKLITAIRENEKQLRETTQVRQKQLADRRKRMRKRIVSEIKSIIRDYAKTHKLKLILEKHSVMGGAEMVVYSNESIDLTEIIKKRVEAETSN